MQDTNVKESVQPWPLVVQQRAPPMNKRKLWRKFDVTNLHESFTEFKGKLGGRNIIDAGNYNYKYSRNGADGAEWRCTRLNRECQGVAITKHEVITTKKRVHTCSPQPSTYLDKIRAFHLENKIIEECAPGASCTEFVFSKVLSALQKENLLQ